MSQLPCSLCSETTRGRLYGFYVTVIKDGVRYKRRLHLCDGCLESLVARYGKDWGDGFVLNHFTAVSKCSTCGKERGERGTLHPMYVTAYSAKGTRYDYFATYCDECADVLIDTFDLAEGATDAA